MFAGKAGKKGKGREQRKKEVGKEDMLCETIRASAKNDATNAVWPFSLHLEKRVFIPKVHGINTLDVSITYGIQYI